MDINSTPAETLPTDLYKRIEDLGVHAAALAHNEETRAASKRLHRVVFDGSLADLPEAIRNVGRAYLENIAGDQRLWAKNRTTRELYALADDIEDWVSSGRRIAPPVEMLEIEW